MDKDTNNTTIELLHNTTQPTPSTYLQFLRRHECLKILGTRTRPRLARCSTLRATVPTTVPHNHRYWPIPDSNLHRKHWFSNDHEWNHPGLHWGLHTKGKEREEDNDTIRTRQSNNNTTPTKPTCLTNVKHTFSA